MTRRALSMALLAVLAGTSPYAAEGHKVTYTCGTVPDTMKRADGRLNTWNLSSFSFTPDTRSAKPVLIRYRSITGLDYGRMPPRRVETPDTAPITLACAVKPERKNYYLTIFYKDLPPDENEGKAQSEWKKQRDEKTQERQDRRDRLERWDSKDLSDLKDDKNQKDSKNRRDPRNGKNARDGKDQRDEKDDRGVNKEMEYFAVFELGDAVLRPALRILETRSGKRINYQDGQARKAAR